MGAQAAWGVSVDQPRIPIKNLYYLLCYSWDQLEQGQLVDVANCPSTELVDLFAFGPVHRRQPLSASGSRARLRGTFVCAVESSRAD